MNKLIQIQFILTLCLCWNHLVHADTMTLTAANNMTPSGAGTKKSVTDTLDLNTSDSTFQRNGVDSASFNYHYHGQASAEGAGSVAGTTGYLNFSFSLVPAIWRISAGFDYSGAVAVTSAAGGAGASDLVLSSGGSAAGLSKTLTGATRDTAGGTTFDETTGIRPAFITTTLNGSGYVRLAFEYGAQCSGTAESYVCLGQMSPLSAFLLDDTWYDAADGVKITLTFTPTLAFTGQTANWDLAMISGETLSGYGTINGDVTGNGTIHPSGTGLLIGDSASSTGFNFGGAVEVTEGDLEIRDLNAAVLLSGSTLTIDNDHILKVNSLQTSNTVNLNSGMLMTANKSGSGVINNTGGTLAAHTSPQAVSINSSYLQEPNGILLVKIASSTSYDSFYFGVSASLKGALKVELLPGFTPAVGQAFTILSFGSGHSERFTNYDLQSLPAGLFWDVSRVPYYGELRIVADAGSFQFDGSAYDTQGWWLDGAYSENAEDPGPFDHSFSIGKSNSTLRLYDGSISGNSNDWWILRLHSPDLTNSASWQNAVGFRCTLQDSINNCGYIGGYYWCPDSHANLYVKVFDVDQQIDRYFYSGTAEQIAQYSSDQRTFLWGLIPTFPDNYIIKDIEVYIWGEMWATSLLDGYVALDSVEPIDCYPADVTGDCHVTMVDLAELSRQWNQSSYTNPCPLTADITGDCEVDIEDLRDMAEQWGQ